MRTGASANFPSRAPFPWGTLSYQLAFPFPHLIAFSGKRSELNRNKPRGRTRCWVPSIPPAEVTASLLLGHGWPAVSSSRPWRSQSGTASPGRSVTSRSPPRLLFPPAPLPRAPASRLAPPPRAPSSRLAPPPRARSAHSTASSARSWAPHPSAPPPPSPPLSPSLLPPSGRPEAGGAREQRPDVRPAGSRRGPSPARPRWRQETFWAAEAWAGRRGSGPPPSSAGTGQRSGVPGTTAALLPLGVPGLSSRARRAGGEGRERLLISARGFELGRRAGPRRVPCLGVAWGGGGGVGPGARGAGELTWRSGSGWVRRADLPALNGLLQLQRCAAGCAAFSFNFKAVESPQSTWTARRAASERFARREGPNAASVPFRSRTAPCEVPRAAPRGSERVALREPRAGGSGASAVLLFCSVAA